MAAIVLFALGPYLWMALTRSRRNPLFARTGTSANRRDAGELRALFSKTTFLENLGHSLVVALGTMIVGLSVSITAAYAFRVPLSGPAHPDAAVPADQHVSDRAAHHSAVHHHAHLGLLDTHLGLVLAHSTFSIPFATWMMISYFDAIPRTLDEAAMVDGCSPVGAMVRVVLPLTLPGIIATGIYIFITSWNEYLYASVLAGQKVRTLTVAIQTLIGEYEIAWGLLTAGGVIGALPVTVLFMLIQRRLVAGMTQGAVKG
jgi:multiple sugar transport system permease protein